MANVAPDSRTRGAASARSIRTTGGGRDVRPRDRATDRWLRRPSGGGSGSSSSSRARPRSSSTRRAASASAPGRRRARPPRSRSTGTRTDRRRYGGGDAVEGQRHLDEFGVRRRPGGRDDHAALVLLVPEHAHAPRMEDRSADGNGDPPAGRRGASFDRRRAVRYASAGTRGRRSTGGGIRWERGTTAGGAARLRVVLAAGLALTASGAERVRHLSDPATCISDQAHRRGVPGEPLLRQCLRAVLRCRRAGATGSRMGPARRLDDRRCPTPVTSSRRSHTAPGAQEKAINGGAMDGFDLFRNCRKSDGYACYRQSNRRTSRTSALACVIRVSDATFETTPSGSWTSHLQLVASPCDGFDGTNPMRLDRGGPPARPGWGCDSFADAAVAPTSRRTHHVRAVLRPGQERQRTVPGLTGRLGPDDHGPARTAGRLMEALLRRWVRTSEGAARATDGQICPTFAECLNGPQSANWVRRAPTSSRTRKNGDAAELLHGHARRSASRSTTRIRWRPGRQLDGQLVSALESGAGHGTRRRSSSPTTTAVASTIT